MESETKLWSVLESKIVNREQVRKLWEKGKITGLFNLPSLELFEQCTDFAVEHSPDTFEIEKFKSRINALEKENEFLRKESNESVLEKQRMAKETKKLNKRLKEKRLECEALSHKLKEVKKTKNGEILQQNEANWKEKYKKLVGRMEEESLIRKEKEERRKQQKEQMLKKKEGKISELSEKIESIQNDYQELNEKYVEVLAQNKHLCERMEDMQKQVEALKRESQQRIWSPSLTDHVNRHLLSSFLTNHVNSEKKEPSRFSSFFSQDVLGLQEEKKEEEDW